MAAAKGRLPGAVQAEVTRALRRAQRKHLFESLARIHAAFPETKCENCARCCFESPGVFFVEYLYSMDELRRLPRARHEALLQRAWHELFFSWVDPDRQCVFLEASHCTLYARRPLACRLFGLVPPRDREQAELEARMAAREEARRLAELGIAVPEAVVTRSLASCDRVRDLQGRPARADADALAAEVARLDEALLPREVVAQEFCFRSLPERLGAALWGQATVETMRFQLLRRAQRGEPWADLLREARQMARVESRSAIQKGRE